MTHQKATTISTARTATSIILTISSLALLQSAHGFTNHLPWSTHQQIIAAQNKSPSRKLPSAVHPFGSNNIQQQITLKTIHSNTAFTKLFSGDDDESSDNIALSDSDQTILGITGLFASFIMLYSESVLFQTGCGLPAGPLGLVGAAEGISYLGVVVLVGYSLFTKIKTVSHLIIILHYILLTLAIVLLFLLGVCAVFVIVFETKNKSNQPLLRQFFIPYIYIYYKLREVDFPLALMEFLARQRDLPIWQSLQDFGCCLLR